MESGCYTNLTPDGQPMTDGMINLRALVGRPHADILREMIDFAASG